MSLETRGKSGFTLGASPVCRSIITTSHGQSISFSMGKPLFAGRPNRQRRSPPAMPSERIRCYLPPELWENEVIRVPSGEAHHLTRVLRLKAGARVTCFDGRGKEATGTLVRVVREEVFLTLRDTHAVAVPAWEVVLGVALPRRGKMDQMVDQATQLGVSRIIPLSTARTVTKVPPGQGNRKQGRLTRVSVEAGKQSGLSRLPAVDPVTGWSVLLRSFGSYDLVLLAAVYGPHEDLGALVSHQRPRKVLILVGPEGDFTPMEIENATHAGARRIWLGPTVLRCETAAVAAVSVVAFLLRQLHKVP